MDNAIQTAWIIDNDEIYKYGFRKYVTIKNFCANVFDFQSGADAIRFLKDPNNHESLPEIIFLNIDMPVMDGWHFIKAFSNIKAQLGKEISIYMVTSSINYIDIIKARCHPEVTAYMIKPTDLKEFSNAFNADTNNRPMAYQC